LAGIYIHIPFCKQACFYCDFHFSTQISNKERIVNAICDELLLQKSYLGNETIASIYFGGGTPSLLTEEELLIILGKINNTHTVDANAEITLEANPDDLSAQKLQQLKNAGVNRLSIGIQSFHDPHLKFMNRAHQSREAWQCVLDAQKIGFDNISIDLIYGIPSKNHKIWQSDLKNAFDLPINHISAYCLTIEPQTVFGNRLSHKKMNPINEEFAAEQFEILLNEIEQKGFEQYEISNFCKPDNYSRHNSSYWKQKRFLGIGPSAHSFDGTTRQFNVASNAKYLKSLAESKVPFEMEQLSTAQQANEYLMTTLRTKWGSELGKLEKFYPSWNK